MPEPEKQPVTGDSGVIVNTCSYCKKPIYSNEEVIDLEPLYFHSSHKSSKEVIAIAGIVIGNKEYMDTHPLATKKEVYKIIDAPPKKASSIPVEKQRTSEVHTTSSKNEAEEINEANYKKVNSVHTEEKKGSEVQSKKVNAMTKEDEKPKKDESPPRKIYWAPTEEKHEISGSSSKTDSQAEEEHVAQEDSSKKSYTAQTEEKQVTQNAPYETYPLQTEDKNDTRENSQPEYMDQAGEKNNLEPVADLVIIACGLIMILLGLGNAILGILSILGFLITKTSFDVLLSLGDTCGELVLGYVGYRLYLYGARKDGSGKEIKLT